MFNIGAFKAPGVDGICAIFFHSQSQEIKTSVFKLINEVYLNSKHIEKINQTLLILIPKVNSPESMKHLRLIGLCNVIFKIVSKIMCNRLKTVMAKLVAPNQCSFIQGRHSLDNIVIAQEIIHNMRHMKGKKGFVVVKVDIETVYDRIEWDFLENTLTDIGFSKKTVDILMVCVKTCHMQVLWNGEASREYKPTRGIRQEDPLSPYLFVLVMERLNQCINAAVG